MYLPLCHGHCGWLAGLHVEFCENSFQVVLLVNSVSAVSLPFNLEAHPGFLRLDAEALLEGLGELGEVNGLAGDEEIVNVEGEDVEDFVFQLNVDAEVSGRACETQLQDVGMDGCVPDVPGLLETVEAFDVEPSCGDDVDILLFVENFGRALCDWCPFSILSMRPNIPPEEYSKPL